MGFDEGRIVLESPNGAYYAGQIVNGKLIFELEKEKLFRGIFLKFKGFCKVHWTTTKSYSDGRGKRRSRTVNHDSYEEYVNVKTYLVGGETGDHKLQPGSYEYPFTFTLPQTCPSSFEGSYGHIRYTIKAVVDRPYKFDQEKKVAVRVFNPLDLNKDPSCREPIEMEFNATYSCCCMGSGATDTVVNVPMSGFCPGQTMPVEVSCNNKGSVEVDDIKICIVKKVRFIATVNPAEKTEKDTIAKITKGPVPPNTSRNYTFDMEIPALDVCNVEDCRYIEVSYKLKAIVSPSGCHSDSDGSRKLVIGNVPLVGYQDNIQNPLHDQMPQHVGVVSQQPLPAYSGNPPYPIHDPTPNLSNDPSKSPYPGRSSPYPSNDGKTPYNKENVPLFNNPPPYPVGNISEKSFHENVSAPYPTDNSSFLTTPYPAQSLPYPSVNPPYPVGNSPGATENSPYPSANPPYPTGNSPYPTSKPPYPTENSPYPTGNTNPTGNPPYPTGSSPYPPRPGVVLRTGTIGFMVAGNNLPTGVTTPAPVNPYAAASAPTLDSPSDQKE